MCITGPIAFREVHRLNIANKYAQCTTGSITSYTHDSINNRVAYDGEEIAINDLNQVLTANGKTYTYDLAGNLIADTEASYSYDALDRLTTVIKNEEKYRYVYDSQNRRIAKHKYRNTPEGWTLSATTQFIYQGDCEVGSVEDDTLTSFRALGVGLGAEIGAAIALEIEGVVYAPTHDQSGSTAALVNAKTGVIVFSARYSAFGQIEKSQGFSPPYQFSSKRYDPETDWIYFGRRYYDPSLGRWTTCDPKGYSDGFNLYAYVHNNPLTHFDEYGLFDGYWDSTPEEIAMYDPQAQYQGIRDAAVYTFTGARDFFFGCTYELGASIHSEFWGDPNDPNRVIPISQRSWTNIGLLIGGTALELSPAKVLGLGGRAVKWLGKSAMKVHYAKKAAEVGERFFHRIFQSTKNMINGNIIPKSHKIKAIAAEGLSYRVPFRINEGMVQLNKADAVIRETFMRNGNFTSKYVLSAEEALEAGMKYLGSGYKELGNPARGVFRSMDGLRQFRIDNGSLMGNHRPFYSHIHYERFEIGSKYGTANNHVRFYE